MSSVVERDSWLARDVEEHQLVGTLGVVVRALFHRVARIAQRLEVDSLHHPAVGDVETGDDAAR